MSFDQPQILAGIGGGLTKRPGIMIDAGLFEALLYLAHHMRQNERERAQNGVAVGADPPPFIFRHFGPPSVYDYIIRLLIVLSRAY